MRTTGRLCDAGCGTFAPPNGRRLPNEWIELRAPDADPSETGPTTTRWEVCSWACVADLGASLSAASNS